MSIWHSYVKSKGNKSLCGLCSALFILHTPSRQIYHKKIPRKSQNNPIVVLQTSSSLSQVLSLMIVLVTIEVLSLIKKRMSSGAGCGHLPQTGADYLFNANYSTERTSFIEYRLWSIYTSLYISLSTGFTKNCNGIS